MLLVRTFVAPSSIHGIGLFSSDAIARGASIWRFEPGLDLVIPEERLEGYPEGFRHFLQTYAYRSVDVPEGLVLSCDHARFFNHSEDPNTELLPFLTLARRDIAAGEELTCDYGGFCEGWTGFD